mmetsp:Transcript_76819/g.126731  ORF Transcript_76819/g.126731 Transcript_76819/m.126731 type:complete len:241 (-) Transcript_76819:240-962(-)
MDASTSTSSALSHGTDDVSNNLNACFTMSSESRSTSPTAALGQRSSARTCSSDSIHAGESSDTISMLRSLSFMISCSKGFRIVATSCGALFHFASCCASSDACAGALSAAAKMVHKCPARCLRGCAASQVGSQICAFRTARNQALRIRKLCSASDCASNRKAKTPSHELNSDAATCCRAALSVKGKALESKRSSAGNINSSRLTVAGRLVFRDAAAAQVPSQSSAQANANASCFQTNVCP